MRISKRLGILAITVAMTAIFLLVSQTIAYAAPVPKPDKNCRFCKCKKSLGAFIEYTNMTGNWILGIGSGTAEDPFIIQTQDFGDETVDEGIRKLWAMSPQYRFDIDGTITAQLYMAASAKCTGNEAPPAFDPNTTLDRHEVVDWANAIETYRTLPKFKCKD